MCVSIAFAVNRHSVVGVVYNPILEELFTSIKGQGAFLNGRYWQTKDHPVTYNIHHKHVQMYAYVGRFL